MYVNTYLYMYIYTCIYTYIPMSIFTQVNADHYKKLLSLVSRSSNLADNSDDKLRGAGAAAVFRLLARYSTFQGAHYRAGGFQVRLCE